MMWSRSMELALGLWLLISPFIFGHGPDARVLWMNDLAAGTLVVLAALLSWWRPLRRLHLVLVPVGLWLAAFGRWCVGYPVPPAGQNGICVGILLVMLAVVPSMAAAPPAPWRTWYARRAALSGSRPHTPANGDQGRS